MATHSYSLHILRHRGSLPQIPPTYTLARGITPRRNGQGGAMPTVHHASWDSLKASLLAIGADDHEIAKAEKNLNEKGSYTITEVRLDEIGLRSLGFSDV